MENLNYLYFVFIYFVTLFLINFLLKKNMYRFKKNSFIGRKKINPIKGWNNICWYCTNKGIDEICNECRYQRHSMMKGEEIDEIRLKINNERN